MSLQNECDLLANLPMFAKATLGQRKLIAMSSNRREYAPGDTLYAEGETARLVMLILSGAVEVSRTQDGRRIPLATVSGASVMGELGVLLGRPRTSTVTAIEPTCVLELEGQVFLELLGQVPSLGMALVKELAVRVDFLGERLSTALAADGAHDRTTGSGETL